MHGGPAMGEQLALAVAAQAVRSPAAQVVVCPPSILLYDIGKIVSGQTVALGGQDCRPELEGAHTGDISAQMLKEAGCQYVIVGHSERRAAYNESNQLVSDKASGALKQGLTPIICIGETLEQRESGNAQAVVSQQVRESLPVEVLKESAGIEQTGKFVLAYEPVWAIGSGKTPTTDDIKQMHQAILSVASQRTGLALGSISVLYGGSVKAANAKDIMAIEAVSGVLVGGASLKADEFCSIIAAA